MGYAHLFFIVQFYFCSIGQIKIVRCYDDIPPTAQRQNYWIRS